MNATSIVSASLVLAGSLLNATARAQCPAYLHGVEQNSPDDTIRCFAVHDDGSGLALYAGGYFSSPGQHVARWNGSGWTGVDLDIPIVYALCSFDDGGGPALYAGGFYFNGVTSMRKWNGSSWSPFGTVEGNVFALAVFDDGSGPALYAGGNFRVADSTIVNSIARWNGSSWAPLSTGVNGSVRALAVYDDGSGPALFAAGDFTTAGGGANFIAKWNGSTWSALGVGVDGVVHSLAVLPAETGARLCAGGGFNHAGGATSWRVASWDGSTWYSMSVRGLSPTINAIGVFDDGSGPHLYAAGYHEFFGRWNGTSWGSESSGLAATSYSAFALAVYEPGVVPAGFGPALYIGGDILTGTQPPLIHIASLFACDHQGERLCAGDGSIAACPCANNGAVGQGCDNSAATGGASLDAAGWTSLAHDSLALTASGELPSVLSIFLQGSVAIAPVPFGDGLRCAGGALKRMYVKNAVSGTARAPEMSEPSVSARSAALGDTIQVGESRVYQTYYRDPNLAFCAAPSGNAWNVTNALRIGWLP